MNKLDQLLEGVDAVLFDSDGTLIDSMQVWGEVDRIYLARYGIEMPENFSQRLAGLSIMQCTTFFREEMGIDEPPEKMLEDWNELARDQYANHVKVKEGVFDFLNELKKRNIKMAVCTSNTTMLAYTALDRHHLSEYMSTIITGEDVIKGKPDPFIYQEAASRLGVLPDRCLVFEDIAEGIMAGKAAGMRVVSVYDAYSEYQTERKKALSDLYIESMTDLFD